MSVDEKRKQEHIQQLIDFVKDGNLQSVNIPAYMIDSVHLNWLESQLYKVTYYKEHELYTVSWAHWDSDPVELQPNTYYNKDTGHHLPQSGY